MNSIDSASQEGIHEKQSQENRHFDKTLVVHQEKISSLEKRVTMYEPISVCKEKKSILSLP